ncbi:hypothetical protein BKA80DRAFT_283240 [Phyllosticta citrichinensis]
MDGKCRRRIVMGHWLDRMAVTAALWTALAGCLGGPARQSDRQTVVDIASPCRGLQVRRSSPPFRSQRTLGARRAANLYRGLERRTTEDV